METVAAATGENKGGSRLDGIILQNSQHSREFSSDFSPYFTVASQVTKYDPFTIYDLLSSIGGTLGLFLGGSIFSIFESMLIFVFFSISMSTLVIRTAFQRPE